MYWKVFWYVGTTSNINSTKWYSSAVDTPASPPLPTLQDWTFLSGSQLCCVAGCPCALLRDKQGILLSRLNFKRNSLLLQSPLPWKTHTYSKREGGRGMVVWFCHCLTDSKEEV